MSTCSTCRAPIQWVQTEAGKAMPVDAGPRWRLTERGAAELRDLPAVVAASERGE